MRIIGRFGLKASLFLYLLSYFVLAGAFLGFFEYPHFILLAALAYLAAYHLACGRILLPLLTYAVGLALLWLNRVAPPSRVLGPLPIDISWVMLYFPFAAGALIIYSVAYATGVAKKILSVILLVAAVIAGHFYMVYAGILWRALVPAIGLAPVFPEPQDFPLYILLYELWRIIHQKPLKLNCQKQTT